MVFDHINQLVPINLLVYVTNLFNIVENRGQADAIYTDLSKTFNTVDHNLLINNNLSVLGVGGQLHSWFNFF